MLRFTLQGSPLRNARSFSIVLEGTDDKRLEFCTFIRDIGRSLKIIKLNNNNNNDSNTNINNNNNNNNNNILKLYININV